MKKSIIIILLLFFWCLPSKAENLVKEYKSFLSKLNKDDVNSISVAIKEYKRIFQAKNDFVSQEKAFEKWQLFYNDILKREDDKLNKNSELENDLWNAERINYKLYAKQTAQKETREYIKELKKNGIDIYFSEGYFYLFQNPHFIYQHFSPYLSESEKEFQKIRTKEITEGFTEDAILIIPWDSIRKRIINWEKYIKKHPKSKNIDFIKVLIKKHYLEFYLSGNRLYDDVDEDGFKIPEEKQKLREDIKESYELFIKENKDSRYYPIVKKYYLFLEKKNFIIDEEEIADFLKKENVDTMLGVQPMVR